VKILVIQTRRLGDVLMITPMLRAIARALPGAETHVCVEASSAAPVRGNPHASQVVIAESRVPVRLVGMLRRERYDVVIDGRGTPGSARLAFLTGAKMRVGCDRVWRRLFYTHRVPPSAGPRYSALGKLALLGPLGIESSDCRIELFPSDDDRREAERRWRSLGLPDRARVVAFSPVSRRRWKRWPAERFAEVCDRWAERAGVVFLPVFGPGEEPMVERVIARLRNRSIVANPGSPVSFGALAPLMARCAFYFGNDNGVRHAAIAAGIPTAAVFGPPNPESWTPPGSMRDFYAGGNCDIDTVLVGDVDGLLPRVIDL